MDYTREISGPTARINNITQTISPSDNAPILQSQLSPFDEERDIIVNHMANDYNNLTVQTVQTKAHADSANEMKRYLKDAEGKYTSIQENIHSSTKDLSLTKENLHIQMAKQKIMFELLAVLGITVLVYIFMGSSPYVHGVALLVIVVGFLYVLNYNAYRLRALGDDIGSPILSSLAKTFTPNGPRSDSKWWDTSFFSPPNAPTP